MVGGYGKHEGKAVAIWIIILHSDSICFFWLVYLFGMEWGPIFRPAMELVTGKATGLQPLLHRQVQESLGFALELSPARLRLSRFR